MERLRPRLLVFRGQGSPSHMTAWVPPLSPLPGTAPVDHATRPRRRLSALRARLCERVEPRACVRAHVFEVCVRVHNAAIHPASDCWIHDDEEVTQQLGGRGVGGVLTWRSRRWTLGDAPGEQQEIRTS